MYAALSVNTHLDVTIFEVTEAVFQRCSVKKGVLRNFAKFTGKHLCQSLFFNTLAGQGRIYLNKPAALTCSFHGTPPVAAFEVNGMIHNIKN